MRRPKRPNNFVLRAILERGLGVSVFCGLAMTLIMVSQGIQLLAQAVPSAARAPFSKSEIVDLLRLGTPDALLIPKIRLAGIDFLATQDDLDLLTRMGASKALLAVIREASELFTFNTREGKFSYALGMNLGQGLHKQSVPTDPSILQLGLRDAISGGKTRLTQDEARAAIMEVQNDISTRHLEKLPQAEEKFSYALGMTLGENLRKQSVPVDPSILQRGLQDALVGGKTLLAEDEAKAAIMAVQTDLRQKQQVKMQQTGASNKQEGEAFLEANKGKNGVVTLPSGLQYKILQQGTGPKPTVTDSVVCNYRGTFINGTEFDSSYKRGQPVTVPVKGVIKGWTEALQLMPVGSKWQLFIPSDLAYGDRGAGAVIGPGATLILEVELMSLQDKSREKN